MTRWVQLLFALLAVSVAACTPNARVNSACAWTHDRADLLDLTNPQDGTTFVSITEAGFTGDGDQLVKQVTDSTLESLEWPEPLQTSHQVFRLAIQDSRPPEGGKTNTAPSEAEPQSTCSLVRGAASLVFHWCLPALKPSSSTTSG